MAWIKRFSQIKTLAGLLALTLVMNPSALVLAQSTPSSVSRNLPNQWNDSFDPPVNGRGTPQGREGGATRGPCIKAKSQDLNDKRNSLIAIVPPSGIGTTVAKYPTFFWYLPPTQSEFAKTIEFKLKDENEQEIYTTKFAIAPDQQGIMSLQLPDSSAILPLEVGKQYFWQVQLICKAPQQDPEYINFEASVVRVAPSPSLPGSSDLQEQLAGYVKSRLWYETLATLAELRRLHPNDQDLADAWAKLLRSVELEKIAQEPMGIQSAIELERFPERQTMNVQTKHIQAQ